MKSTQQSSVVIKDYQKLSKLLGIDYQQIKSSEAQPKWRKLEVLNELKALNRQMDNAW